MKKVDQSTQSWVRRVAVSEIWGREVTVWKAAKQAGNVYATWSVGLCEEDQAW